MQKLREPKLSTSEGSTIDLSFDENRESRDGDFEESQGPEPCFTRGKAARHGLEVLWILYGIFYTEMDS